MRVARPVVLSAKQRETLESRSRARSSAARSVERARIILLAASGMQDKQIADKLRIMPEKAARWRNRFLDGGLAALDKDAPRPGRPSTITPATVQDVVRKTTQEKPSNATHWSTRSMAKTVGLSEKTIRRIWHKHGLKPHLSRTFKVSNDPQFAEKVETGPEADTTRSGLPVRRPGGRLVPGGVASESTDSVVRDPEAIRNRLAAHAAGVSRGRAAAAAQPLNDDYAHEETGPA